MSSYRFKIPFEHGAWWSFFTTLMASSIFAATETGEWVLISALASCLTIGFILQDWAQDLIASALNKRSQSVSQWKAWQGWLLSFAAAGLAIFIVWTRKPEEQNTWIYLFTFLVVLTSGGLVLRIVQKNRGRKSLAITSALLALPALPFGYLALGLNASLAAFIAWPLIYYPSSTLAAQSFVRGFPVNARWLGPSMMDLIGIAAVFSGAWLGGAFLMWQGTQLQRSITRRWKLFSEGLPPGKEIRAFGKGQAFSSAFLAAIWIYKFI